MDAARSGSLLDGQVAWLQTTVTGPGTLSFWWNVSSEEGADPFELYAAPDGVESIGDEAFADVPHIYYHGPANGEPWGANEMN